MDGEQSEVAPAAGELKLADDLTDLGMKNGFREKGKKKRHAHNGD